MRSRSLLSPPQPAEWWEKQTHGERSTSRPSLLFDPLVPMLTPLSFLSLTQSSFWLLFHASPSDISSTVTHRYKQWKTTNGLMCFLPVSNRCHWCSGLQMRLWRKTRWMGVLVLVPLSRSSRRTGLNSRCCLGCHILAVIPLQCRVRLCVCDRWGDHEWEPPGTEKNGLRSFSITRSSGDFDQSFCAAG